MKTLNILIPTDLSPLSEQALLMADLISERLAVKVHLLHIIEANESIIEGNPDLAEAIDVTVFQKRKEEALTYFDGLRQAGRTFEAHIKIGLLTDQIHLVTAALAADLVIMATKGADGLMEIISGSAAQQVVRYLKVPILTLKIGTAINDLKNILFVADFYHIEKGLQIDLVKDLAAAFGSTIHLLQILKEGDEEHVGQINAQMKRFAEEHEFERFEIHVHQDRQVANGVSNFNKEAEMDLVCINTHGRTGIAHLLFGSIAERLVNHCQKPLLTFKLKENA
ncbi:nucleotide-binding universal stress UspA family protein [Pedobacter sp. CG_S7]|uniref:universal stress protein n=1 Tax=Pedobacter sp. CG_S7 TaxID=3143930 RepID=UPI00339386E7